MPVVIGPVDPAGVTRVGAPPAGTGCAAAGIRPVAHLVLRRMLEVLDGRRPAVQLADAVTEPVLRYLISAAGRLDDPRYSPLRASGRRAGPPRIGSAERMAGAGLRSMRICQPVDGVAEVSVVWRHRGRFRALAARFELPCPGRPVPPSAADARPDARLARPRPSPDAPNWRCTVLRIG
jgi:hypothetical protein